MVTSQRVQTPLLQLQRQSQLFSLGQHKTPVLVVDSCCKIADDLCRYADCEATFRETADFYPGVKSGVPIHYFEQVLAPLGELIATTFIPNASAEIQLIENSFAIATSSPEQLLAIQRIPHFDSHNPRQIAAVHYLCGGRFGGTSFYRHRETALETITSEQAGRYKKTLERQATTVGLPGAAYINGDTPLFKRIGAVPAVFNRIIFYPSHLLHSGDLIRPLEGLSTPSSQRLTITSSILLTG